MTREAKPYLAYLYESNGLRPIPSFQHDPLIPALSPPRPTTTTAFEWLASELHRKGSTLNHVYDGIVVLINKNQTAIAETIVSSSEECGFFYLPEKDLLQEPVSQALEKAGLNGMSFAGVVLLEKDP